MNFLGPGEESKPKIEVTYRYLGEEPETVTNSEATTGRTPDEGTFMSVGFQPDLQGCWEVTAKYKGATLTYVYYSAEGRTLTIEVPNLIGVSVPKAADLLQEVDLYIFFTDQTDFSPNEIICAQRPEAGATLRRFDNVEIISSKADEECEELPPLVLVPDVDGLDVDLAIERLLDAGITPLADSYDPGRVVCTQDPEAGTEIRPVEYVSLVTFLPGGCEEFLSRNGIYSRVYQDEEGWEWYGTDCPAADVLIRGGIESADGLPKADENSRERVESLLMDSGSDLIQPGMTSFQALPLLREVWDSAENGDVVVLDSTDDYMIKVTKDESFECPSAPYSWNGIPVAFMNS